MSAARVYFPGLNGLRFFAAFAVIVTHVELMKKYLGFNNTWYDPGQTITSYPLRHILDGDIKWYSPLIAEAGPLGVIFFFVLSGFLITYLMFVERENMGRISVRKFYLRRIYRIWPLYYFIFILGFFVLPHFEFFYVPGQTEDLHSHFWGNFWTYLAILPNLGYSMHTAMPNIGQSWSIGVEEQFYLIWPLIIRFFKRPLHAILWVTGGLLSLKALVVIVIGFYSPDWMIVIMKFLAMSKIECMAIGAFGAWMLYYKKDALLSIMRTKTAQIGAFLGIIAVLFLTPAILQNGAHLVFGGFFLIIILNVSTNPNSLVKLENKLFNSLGKISYGIYMYHLLVVVFTIHSYKWAMNKEDVFTFLDGLMVYLIATLLTIGISWLSYTYFEHRFIRRKSNYSRVLSGDEAKK